MLQKDNVDEEARSRLDCLVHDSIVLSVILLWLIALGPDMKLNVYRHAHTHTHLSRECWKLR